MNSTFKVVILAAGDFPTHSIPLKTLSEANFVVCCDSAYKEWKVRSGKWKEGKPFVVIGDGDSLSRDDKATLGDRWIHVAEQDYNDLHKAMQWAIAKFSILNSQFSILAATGKREDHTLGNISYLVTFAEEYPDANIGMLTDYGHFEAFRGCRTFTSFPRQQVSIFTFSPDTVLQGTGLQYPLDGLRADRWWQATLNSALGDTFTLDADGWAVVFRTYNPK